MYPPGIPIPDELDNGLENLFHMQEGCFDYYRHGNLSGLTGFRNAVLKLIVAAMQDNKNHDLFLLENANPEVNNPADIQITKTEVQPFDLTQIVESDDFNSGWAILASAPPAVFTDDCDFAKRTWLRVIQCKVQNESPDSELFGSAETFSITGDSNILTWTNRTLPSVSLQLAALDAGFVVAEEKLYWKESS
uniref:Reverse transcriptase domain-containing protein n=1 Tax=Panagrellus redivivus TaxID=6233 RepID=A0A7E4VES8_PANRE